MSRFLLIFVIVFTSFNAMAQTADVKYTPPISGDMVKMTVLDKPVQIPDVMISSSDKGLIYLSEYKTKLVVLNLWATWCPPCIQELPSLNALQHAMGGNLFDVVTVSLDTNGPEAVKKYLTDNKLDDLPGFIDTNGDIQKLEVLKGVPGVPVTLILSPQMRVLAKIEGDVDWNGKAARDVLEYYAKNISYASF